jgi:hypothetical protein
LTLFSSGAAQAQATQVAPQTPPPAAPVTTAPAATSEGQVSTSTTFTTTTVAPATTPPPAVEVEVKTEDDDRTDHQNVVGGWGVGLLSAVELQPLLPGPTYPEASLVVAILGARTWISEGFGFEVGLGFNTRNGTRADDVQGRSDVPEPTTWGLALHLGLPFSLYNDEHYHFLLLPELNFGMAMGKTEDDANLPGDQAVRQRAQLVGGGLRAGAEVQFGMIGLPMLALTGTVGVRLDYQQSSVEAAENGAVITRVRRGFDASTSSFNDPWDIFVSSIAALYYFR